MTPSPLDGPFMTSHQMTDSSSAEGYAIPPSPERPALSRARQLREAAIGR